MPATAKEDKSKSSKKTTAAKKSSPKRKKSKVKKDLVIVESPAKAHTIEKYLGRKYRVIASKGHIRDLPKSQMGVDIDHDYQPKYISIRGKGDTIKELKAEAKKANKVYLASDPDREGEAIAWHVAHVLGLDEKEANRVTFNEVTKDAVKDAFNHPDHRYGHGQRSAGPPGLGPLGRLLFVADSLVQGQEGAVSRPGAVSCLEAGYRPGKGN